ncbi:zinc finger CCHC domain-containing protein 2 isoform X1 [Xenopus laevis]|uniref:Zinc finger CCHC domain-containing protein 2 isoform X1 n=2 Tax=Xenopus laevis TaxID=8355 RepID=A0A1L8FXN9_XENLA|nr:zinc finger CCHC domain-containing protein 2 isoform X1 [Xenopus laevis]OCT76343.1 hypothetical protein XELAEV_18031542mg [Xenopus laevis]
MLKMKLVLPLKKSKHKASDEEEEDEAERAAMCDTPRDWAAPDGPLHRETVYHWFVKSLGPANRLEFAYGLLDLCNPLELRFLGSCLEDLARKDCHYLRECENKANGLAGEPLLGDLGEPISRAKLIIYLALLNSGSREVASRLYRLLLPEVGIERVLGGREEQEEEDSAEGAAAREELLLLFTMASLHPAFTFHQRVTLRERLDRLREAMGRKSRAEGSVNEFLPNSENHVSPSDSLCHNGINATRKLQHEAVHIEKITFKGAQRKRADKNLEYTFKVTWSDQSVTFVTKSHHELLEFFLMLPNELSREAFDETILRALNQGSQKREDRRHTDLEPIIRQIFASPSHALLQNQKVYTFFHSLPMESSLSHSNVQATQKTCKTQEILKEDSSEASSQEEEMQQHLTIYKKPSGKCPVVNTTTIKSSPTDGLHIQSCRQNGEKDWKNTAFPKSSNSGHCINLEHVRTVDNWNIRMNSREKTLSQRFNADKIDGRSISRTNGVKIVQNLRTTVGNEPTLEVGSGHDTCGETSSESYSSPSSPRHDRRESFESEDEKEGDTDSNSDESSKNGSRFLTIGTVTAPTSKCVSLGNDKAHVNNNMQLPKYSHIPFLAPMHCVISNGSEKFDPVLISSGTVSSVREPFSQAPIGMSPKPVASATGEPEKHVEILASLPLPSTFLPRNCQPSNHALHLPVSKLKISSPQGPAETCTKNCSAQNGLALGMASGFISGHHSMGFSSSPSAVADPISKQLSQVVGLNQAVPHYDGGAMPPPTNLKLVLPGTNLSPAPSAVPNPLPGASLASAVLPKVNTNFLNAAATTASCQPANAGIGQAAIPPAVPTHTPGPAPSPSPALTHSTAQSDSTSFISVSVNNTSTNGTLLTPHPVGPGACGSCGRRCSCGNNGGAPVSYIYANTIPGPVYRGPPFLTFVNGTYLNQAHQSNGAQLPFYLTPFPNGLMHDPLLGGQTSYGMQQMPGYGRFFPGYQTPVVAGANGSGPKKSAGVSCYNCGLAGHYANDCKQPHMEANQQGNRDNSQRTCF